MSARASEGPSAENVAAKAKYQPQVLDRMVTICQREADRIEVWQRTGADGLEVPEDKWDAGERQRRNLFRDLAQLVTLVQLVEPQFKKLVRPALAARKLAREEAAHVSAAIVADPGAAAEEP